MSNTQSRDNSLDLKGINLGTRVRLNPPVSCISVPTSSLVGVVTGFAPQRNRHGNQAVVVEFPRVPSDTRKGPQRVFVKDPAWLLAED